MSEELKESILEQELDDDQLNLVAGGATAVGNASSCTSETSAASHCVINNVRDAKVEGCAATVEANSWCKKNDACLNIAIDYIGCFKADVDCLSNYWK